MFRPKTALPLATVLVFCAIALLISTAACNLRGATDDEAATVDSTELESTAKNAFRVVFAGDLVDTLKGKARFGKVVDPQSGKEMFLIELESPTDFAGGVFITLGDTSMPDVGKFELGKPAEKDSVLASQYRLAYRQDLVRDMKAVSGTVAFKLVSDTLIQGTFDAVLRGRVRRTWEGDVHGEVSARGRFSAVPGPAGYVIGL